MSKNKRLRAARARVPLDAPDDERIFDALSDPDFLIRLSSMDGVEDDSPLRYAAQRRAIRLLKNSDPECETLAYISGFLANDLEESAREEAMELYRQSIALWALQPEKVQRGNSDFCAILGWLCSFHEKRGELQDALLTTRRRAEIAAGSKNTRDTDLWEALQVGAELCEKLKQEPTPAEAREMQRRSEKAAAKAPEWQPPARELRQAELNLIIFPILPGNWKNEWDACKHERPEAACLVRYRKDRAFFIAEDAEQVRGFRASPVLELLHGAARLPCVVIEYARGAMPAVDQMGKTVWTLDYCETDEERAAREGEAAQ